MKIKLAKAGRYMVGNLPVFVKNEEREVSQSDFDVIPKEDQSLFEIVKEVKAPKTPKEPGK